MIKIIGIAVAALILSVILKQYNRAFSIALVICSGVIIFLIVLNEITNVFDVIFDLADNIENSTYYVKLMVKSLGICLISQIVADMCRDSGESALASEVELSGKVIIIAIILPLFTSMLNIVSGIVK